MPDTSSTAAPGQVLAGRYHLEALVATGGMAQVWRATDTVLQRQVAVKILHPHLAQDESFVARFRSEAVAAARLRHPSIVAIYDTCSDAGMQAIVMELVRGQNLRQRLNETGTLSPREAVHVGAEVADALATAHRAGLVHRDIKPANIMLCEDHRVVVTDFGIAKIRGDADLTQTGLMIGSVKYLSPEQVEGKPLDGRADVYSLGIVLYEALCGRPPFVGDTDAATALLRLQANPVRPRQIKPGIPRSLESIVIRAMARDPAQRFGSAADLRAALLAARLDDDGAVPAPAPRRQAAQVAPTRPRPAPRPQPQPQSFARSERNWLVPTLVIILVALSLALAGVLIGRTDVGEDLFGRARDAVDEQSSPPADPSSGAIPIARVTPFDPEGDGGPTDEREDLAPLAIDGDRSNGWATESYDDRQLGNKSGVGIVLTLEQASSLDAMTVVSPTSDWSAEIYVSDEPGATLADWGEPVAAQAAIPPGEVTFDLGGVDASLVLLWITDRGNGTPSTRAEIDEVTLSGG